MRKVIAHSASNGVTKNFETSATTWGELKADLEAQDFYITSSVSVTEGYSKIVFAREDMVLPVNTPFKTGTTNDLAIFISPSKNINSGSFNRIEAYAFIKSLPESVRKNYFPGYSSVSSVNLIKMIDKYKTDMAKQVPSSSEKITTRQVKLNPAAFSIALNDIYSILVDIYTQSPFTLSEMEKAKSGVKYLANVLNVDITPATEAPAKKDPSIVNFEEIAKDLGFKL